jgi:CrcB protein
MKGLEFIFLGVGSVLGAYLRYKITESPLLFNTIPVNVLMVNVVGAFILGIFVVLSQQWHLDGKYSLFAAVGLTDANLTGVISIESSFKLPKSSDLC